MKSILRMLALGAALALSAPAFAADQNPTAIQGKDIMLPAKERQVKVTQFKMPGDAKRPSVLMLHGAGGWGRRLPDYNTYAANLASHGIDAYLVYYYSAEDETAMRTDPDRFENRYVAWARLVGDLADDLAKEKDSNGQVGLIGFSNGGILSTGAGALDPKIGAAVIYYGTEPWPLGKPATHLPPLLVLHGDADMVIPVENGIELAAVAKKLGAPVDLVIYPGEPHGFGADFTKKDATDAMNRAVAFLRQRLGAK